MILNNVSKNQPGSYITVRRPWNVGASVPARATSPQTSYGRCSQPSSRAELESQPSGSNSGISLRRTAGTAVPYVFRGGYMGRSTSLSHSQANGKAPLRMTVLGGYFWSVPDGGPHKLQCFSFGSSRPPTVSR